jgi:hypothetical protein
MIPMIGGSIAPPHTPTISKADISFAFSGIFLSEQENMIENKFAYPKPKITAHASISI